MTPSDSAIRRFRRAGFSVSLGAEAGDDNRTLWVVTATRGEQVIRAEGPTSVAAWRAALAEARAAGLVDER